MSSIVTHVNRTEVIPEVFSCILERDLETGRWNGHCLDFDIVTSGPDQDETWLRLKRVVRLHVEQCFTNWRPGLQRKASIERWKLFEWLDARDRDKPFRQDTIQLDLIAPEDDLGERWMKAFAFPEGTLNGRFKGSPLQ